MHYNSGKVGAIYNYKSIKDIIIKKCTIISIGVK